MDLQLVIPDSSSGAYQSVGHRQHNIHRHARSASLPNVHKVGIYDGNSVPYEETAILACLLLDNQKVLMDNSPSSTGSSLWHKRNHPAFSSSQSSLSSSPISYRSHTFPVTMASPLAGSIHHKSRSYPVYPPNSSHLREVPAPGYSSSSIYSMPYATYTRPEVYELPAEPVAWRINKRYLDEKPLPKEPGKGRNVTKRMRKKAVTWFLQRLKTTPNKKAKY